MIKCIVIDDEPNAIENLVIELEIHKTIHILKTFLNAKEALNYLNNNIVDLVFLDIEMPFMNGFQLLQEVDLQNFDVVITTAYNNYAIKAFKHNAIDYLLKPINSEELAVTVEKINSRFLTSQKNASSILLALNELASPKKIAFKNNGKLMFFEPNEISHVISDGNYSKVFLSNKETLYLTKKIKEIEELLPNHLFLRVHNSYIINIQKIKSFVVADNFIILKNNINIPVSKTYKSILLTKI